MSTPKRKSRADRARDIALYRYSLIRPLADPGLSPTERGRLVRELAAQVHLGPSGEPVTVSRASLDRWIRAWRAGGFDALIPAERQVAPRTEAEALELAARLKREHPARTAAHITRIVEAERGWAPSPRTLQRHFARLELNTRPTAARRRRSGGSRPPNLTRCGSATACTARSSRAGGRCCSRRSTITPGTCPGTAGATARTPWACRQRCTMRSRPTAAHKNCTATTEAPTPAASWPGRRRYSTSGWCTADPENRRDAGKSSGGTAPCATSSWSRSTRPPRDARWGRWLS